METEISKLKIDNKLDILIAIDLLWCKLFDGWTCEKCGIVQGESRKGWNKYYCEHITKSIDRKLFPIKKRLTREVLINLGCKEKDKILSKLEDDEVKNGK